MRAVYTTIFVKNKIDTIVSTFGLSRYYRVLTMVYNTQRYWVFGLCPSSGFFLNNNEKTKRFGNWICD
jgi:hypothetical protein